MIKIIIEFGVKKKIIFIPYGPSLETTLFPVIAD